MILFIAVLLLTGTTARATDQTNSDHKKRVTKRYTNAQPITFVEKGIQFFVYPNGDIDYKILRRYRNQNNWGRNANNSPGTYRDRNPYNRFVQYDHFGRLKKVGSNYISYDRYNRVRRIGSVSIRYNRNGLVHQLGSLQVFYNRYGRIRYTKGNVHYTECGYCGTHECDMTHNPHYNQNWKQKYDDDDDDDNDNDDDDNYKYRKRKKRSNDD